MTYYAQRIKPIDEHTHPLVTLIGPSHSISHLITLIGKMSEYVPHRVFMLNLSTGVLYYYGTISFDECRRESWSMNDCYWEHRMNTTVMATGFPPVKWTCPVCKSENQDDPDVVDIPLCPVCSCHTTWDDMVAEKVISDINDLFWTCPQCEAKNVDSYETPFPICHTCFKMFGWHDTLPWQED